MPQEPTNPPGPAEDPPPARELATVKPVVPAVPAVGGAHDDDQGDDTEEYVSLIGVRTLGLMVLKELIGAFVKKLLATHNLNPADVRSMLEKLSDEVT